MEQIRAETEQWSQMQEILGQVKDEMEELQASRAFWEDKAISSNYEVQSLNRVVSSRKSVLINSIHSQWSHLTHVKFFRVGERMEAKSACF